MPSEHGHRREYTSGVVECYGFGYGYGYGVCDNGYHLESDLSLEDAS